jgi:hypothetical protein
LVDSDNDAVAVERSRGDRQVLKGHIDNGWIELEHHVQTPDPVVAAGSNWPSNTARDDLVGSVGRQL